uniref:Uncharacterized protein n=1 Tax=Globisporangium ultimum (strain ATCC 200006 / CBS 805.95 / DAOM BR144) TaxID=431595 RepID=K3XCV6_GLOUD
NGGRNSDGPKVAKFLVGQLTEVYKERNGISLLDCFKSQCLMKIKGLTGDNFVQIQKAAIKAIIFYITVISLIG